ncbi:hypothetical protein QVD17_26929 [Tagetes erecta]|uniref:Uncharacterized protein n=1 Tax=Tagetes erecta TaxID=13708 RepID=A0AAD8NIY8_TARER|nr:hypothetical protein QVD17_26929 [Tagetes erecta]
MILVLIYIEKFSSFYNVPCQVIMLVLILLSLKLSSYLIFLTFAVIMITYPTFMFIRMHHQKDMILFKLKLLKQSFSLSS